MAILLVSLDFMESEVHLGLPYKGAYCYRKGDLAILPGSRVVAFHNYHNAEPFATTVPGFFIKDLEPERGLRRIEVKPVPKEKQADVAEMLRRYGYQGHINFW